jgi:hypothetical protein
MVPHIEDLRRLAKKRVPRMFYDYTDNLPSTAFWVSVAG